MRARLSCAVAIVSATRHYPSMRVFCGCVILGFGCGSSPAPRAPLSSPPPAVVEVALPVVLEATDARQATDLHHPSAIVFIDEIGAFSIGRTGTTWSGTLPAATTPVKNPLTLKRAILTAMADDGGPESAHARAMLEAEVHARTTGRDDPPPPEEEDKPDDDESGGSGTAMALEEGKMGKKDSDRAE